jgi:hypothetical protein
MNQQELWAEKVGVRKPTQNFRRASRTQLSRVARLHRWRNQFTGETCEQTISEFSKSKKISVRICQNMCVRNVGASAKGWKHEAYLKKVIQGDVIDWLTNGPVRNGSKSIQSKAKASKAWENIIVMMARYHEGKGVKTIAKEFKLSPGSVLNALKEAGIDTTKRRNYFKPSDSLTLSERKKARWRENMEIPSARLRKTVMNRIWSAMKNQRVNGVGSFSLVGCSVGFLRSYIEGKFEKGMTWENYGEWHVDHIRPCASFDLNDKEQVLQCFNWRNLQPMWASENISKGSNYAQA